jgi:hypothetical protein
MRTRHLQWQPAPVGRGRRDTVKRIFSTEGKQQISHGACFSSLAHVVSCKGTVTKEIALG